MNTFALTCLCAIASLIAMFDSALAQGAATDAAEIGHGEYVAIAGLMTKVKSAKLVKTGKDVPFTQDEFRVRFTDLQREAPDYPLTTIAIECESEPRQDTDFVRKNKPRMGV